ncbi:hypothetical protein KGQ71_02620, partial [Patescibacteria group bacterium]|nr:hypothetical protein [Patescibacteria group bacterium]
VANAQAGESTSLAQTFSVEEIFAQINRNRDQIVNPEGLWVLAKYILAYRMRSAGEGTKNGSSLSYPEKGLKLG